MPPRAVHALHEAVEDLLVGDVVCSSSARVEDEKKGESEPGEPYRRRQRSLLDNPGRKKQPTPEQAPRPEPLGKKPISCSVVFGVISRNLRVAVSLI